MINIMLKNQASKDWTTNIWSDFDKVFKDFGNLSNFSNVSNNYNLIKKENEYVLEFNVAGCLKENIKISTNDNMLTVEHTDLKSNEDKKENYLYKSFSAKSFKQMFDLDGFDSNNIKAENKDGILKISLPILKKDKPKGKIIEIQ